MRTGLLSAAVIDTDPSCPPLLARAAFPPAPPSGARRTSCRMVARAGPAGATSPAFGQTPYVPADVSAGTSRAHGSVGSLLYQAGADQPFAKPPGFYRWPPDPYQGRRAAGKVPLRMRSEERRVGKECRSGWAQWREEE